jgi:hypothetical protein
VGSEFPGAGVVALLARNGSGQGSARIPKVGYVFQLFKTVDGKGFVRSFVLILPPSDLLRDEWQVATFERMRDDG